MERKTDWGLPIKEIYTPKDVKEIDYLKDLNDPGEYPFTRGTHRSGYRTKEPSKKMTLGFGLPEDTNKRIKFLSGKGQAGGITIVADRATMMTIDSDHPMARKEAGLVGVALNSVADLEELLDGIPIEAQSLSFQFSPSSNPVGLAQLIVLAEKRRINPAELRGSMSCSPFSSIFGQEDAQPFDLAWKVHIDQLEYEARNKMKFYTVPAVDHHLQESGITPPYQLGIVLAAMKEVCDGLLERGLEIDDFAHKFYCTVSVSMRFFEEIAKIRALRKMWARMAKEKYGAKNPRTWHINLPVKTSGVSLTYQQPLNNIVRGAIECLAGVIGGGRALELSAFDEPHCEPTELSSRIALNTQYIVLYETGVADTVDPLGGSYYVEYLTKKIEEEAYKVWDEIEGMGGLRAAIKAGWYDRVWHNMIYENQKAVDNGDRVVIGVNKLVIPPEEEESIPLHEVSSEVSEAIGKKLKEFKKARDAEKVRQSLYNLYKDAQRGEKFNLMPSIIEAVRSCATIGEIWGSIRQANGLSYDPLGIVDSPFTFK